MSDQNVDAQSWFAGLEYVHPGRYGKKCPCGEWTPPRQTGKLASPCKRCGTMFDTAAIGFTCEDCEQKAERIAAAQQSVLEAAKAWRASINQDEWPTLLAKTMLAVDALAEAEKGEQ